MKRFLVLAIVFAVGCSDPLAIDRDRPFSLEFGRGSGLSGLETVKLDQNGRVIIHRETDARSPNVNVSLWETASLSLPPESVAEILEAVESNALTSLSRAYHASIIDGTQWVFWIKQGDREKSVYFDNRFPHAITRFAAQLDAILSRAGLESVTWTPVPDNESRQHEKELWSSIERR